MQYETGLTGDMEVTMGLSFGAVCHKAEVEMTNLVGGGVTVDLVEVIFKFERLPPFAAASGVGGGCWAGGCVFVAAAFVSCFCSPFVGSSGPPFGV